MDLDIILVVLTIIWAILWGFLWGMLYMVNYVNPARLNKEVLNNEEWN